MNTGNLDIKIIHLSDIFTCEGSQVKFILLADGRLLYGRCMYHKDLAVAFFDNEEERNMLTVIGAGVVPEDPATQIEDEEAWGYWKSTGYKVVTEEMLREKIREAFIVYNK
jgi:hypothetical protein